MRLVRAIHCQASLTTLSFNMSSSRIIRTPASPFVVDLTEETIRGGESMNLRIKSFGDAKRLQAVSVNPKKKDPLAFFSKKEKYCMARNINIFRLLMRLAYEALEKEEYYDDANAKQRIHGCALTYAKAAASVATFKKHICTTSMLSSLKGIGKAITSRVYEEGLVVIDVV